MEFVLFIDFWVNIVFNGLLAWRHFAKVAPRQSRVLLVYIIYTLNFIMKMQFHYLSQWDIREISKLLLNAFSSCRI